jgi:hypothetical protein
MLTFVAKALAKNCFLASLRTSFRNSSGDMRPSVIPCYRTHTHVKAMKELSLHSAAIMAQLYTVQPRHSIHNALTEHLRRRSKQYCSLSERRKLPQVLLLKAQRSLRTACGAKHLNRSLMQ